MGNLTLFLIFSLPIVAISRRSLFNLRGHGFYRFISWECILWIFIKNYQYWFSNPDTINQVFSWLFLFISLSVLIPGVISLKRRGDQSMKRNDINLYEFEKTTQLVDTGIYKYIRHPLYSSLLFLTWGICMKNPTAVVIVVSIISTAALLITAMLDEKECISYFGEKYKKYMQGTKRFFPFMF